MGLPIDGKLISIKEIKPDPKPAHRWISEISAFLTGCLITFFIMNAFMDQQVKSRVKEALAYILALENLECQEFQPTRWKK